MLKYIVICGPDLNTATPGVQSRVRASIAKLTVDAVPPQVLTFPEADAGGSLVRAKVQEIVFSERNWVFITRYEHVVSEFANMVAEGTLRPNQVVFCLWRDGVGFTEHQMDGEFVGNEWPMGILW